MAAFFVTFAYHVCFMNLITERCATISLIIASRMNNKFVLITELYGKCIIFEYKITKVVKTTRLYHKTVKHICYVVQHVT